MWEDDLSPRIALKYLYLPSSKGGLNLLNIHARNEAVEIIWLKSYLNFTTSWPIWAMIMDLILNKATPPGISQLAQVNTFLQLWDVPNWGARLQLLNDDIIRMLKAARKYRTHLAAICLSPQLQAQLPTWYHPLMTPCSMATASARCLLRWHTVMKVTDLIMMSNRVCFQDPNSPHLPSPACNCQECFRDKQDGCANPHQCTNEAFIWIQRIKPKLNPLSPGFYQDKFSLTPGQKAANTVAKENDDKILFDPSITCKNNLAECFRIFANPDRISNLPATQNFTCQFNLQYRNITIYTNGACFNNRKLNACCESGIWFAPNDLCNEAFWIPSTHQSNQIGKIAAVIHAISVTPPFQPLTIILDLKYVIKGLTDNLNTWENSRWIGIKNSALFKRAAYLLKCCTTTTHFKWVKGHNGDQGNEECN